jgi:NitT/TauT family transport system ATP-binding protein
MSGTLEAINNTTHATGIRLRGVSRTFPGGVEAVRDVDLDVSAGEFVAMIGPSGCGKSTLLRMIAGLDVATSGTISIGQSTATGEAFSGGVRRAFVFQDAHLLPWRNVVANVALPLELSGVESSERLRRASDALAQVGLSDAGSRYPAQLSGGMKMRVSLARALVTEPELLLLDEPFAALDEITRQQLDDQLRELWQRRRMTTIFVTHSIMEAAYLAQRAIVFTRRPAQTVIDHRLSLPEERTAALRGEPAFAREMGILFSGLERGQEAPA